MRVWSYFFGFLMRIDTTDILWEFRFDTVDTEIDIQIETTDWYCYIFIMQIGTTDY